MDKVLESYETQDVDTMLFQCCPTVCYAGPTLAQDWLNTSCLSGESH